jgi:hypothetical protein
MKKRVKGTLILVGVLLLVLMFSNEQLASKLFGGYQSSPANLLPGNIGIPTARTIVWKTKSAFADSICNQWAAKAISDKNLDGKGNVPRILLAKLWMKQDIPEVNRIILKLTAWGISGSSWALNKKGDYDFSITIYTTILYLFGDQPELLYPDTKDYLLKVLLTEEGNKFRSTAPRTLGLAPETENHILMTEGSRYLKNRWLMNHGSNDQKYDNLQNGMEEKLLVFMDKMRTNGLYEFNSLPYIGYTITALLNLEAFGSDKLKVEARNVLDYMNWTYALGSYQLKHYPPMRRRYEKAGIKEITTDYQSIFMKSWLSFSPVSDYDKDISSGEVHALMGAIMPYRPADKVVEIIFDKGDGYFVKLGHGPKSSPEIYSAGEKFLISAGGVNRGERSIIVARPITLFLNDHAGHLSQTFHLAGPGTDFKEWNNTGVYENFACAAGPVSVPDGYKVTAENEIWQIFSTSDSLLVAVHSEANFGLLFVFKNSNASTLLAELTKANPNAEELKRTFRYPDGKLITYDVLAPKDKWVIVSANGLSLDRDFDNWPLINGHFNEPTGRSSSNEN